MSSPSRIKSTIYSSHFLPVSINGRMNSRAANRELTYTSGREKEVKVVCRHQMISNTINLLAAHPNREVVSLFHKVCGNNFFIICFMGTKVLIFCEILANLLINLC